MAISRPRMEYLPHLPDELIEDIFGRLPAEVISWCKSLSKYWYEKISETKFVKSHFRQMSLQNRVRTLLQPEHCFVPLQYFANDGGVHLNRRVIYHGIRDFEYVANCRSLALVVDSDDHTYMINPATDQRYPVPEEPMGFPKGSKSASVLYGLAYNHTQEDYKVVRLALFHHMDWKIELRMYSKNTNQWKNCGEFPHSRLVTNPGVYANSCVHWLLYTEQVVAFNVVDESYRLINLPSEANRDYRHHSFSALNGEKLIFMPTFYIADESVDLWILDDYSDDKTWSKYSVVLDFPIRNVYRVINFQPLFMMEPKWEKIVFRINPLGTYWCWDMKALRFLPMPGEPIVNVSSITFPCVEGLT